jgi:hypothetical protein
MRAVIPYSYPCANERSGPTGAPHLVWERKPLEDYLENIESRNMLEHLEN